MLRVMCLMPCALPGSFCQGFPGWHAARVLACACGSLWQPHQQQSATPACVSLSSMSLGRSLVAQVPSIQRHLWASCICLHWLCSRVLLARQVYNEDAIERIAELLRFNLQANVLALHDARLAAIHRPALLAQQGVHFAVVHRRAWRLRSCAGRCSPVNNLASQMRAREVGFVSGTWQSAVLFLGP